MPAYKLKRATPGLLLLVASPAAAMLVLALSNDNEALFAATVVREFAPDVPLIARFNQAQTVKRL